MAERFESLEVWKRATQTEPCEWTHAARMSWTAKEEHGIVKLKIVRDVKS